MIPLHLLCLVLECVDRRGAEQLRSI
jgi:hypothetical protein